MERTLDELPRKRENYTRSERGLAVIRNVGPVLSCHGETPYEPSGAATFPLRKYVYLKKVMNISPRNVHKFQIKLRTKCFEKAEDKYLEICPRIRDFSKAIWQRLKAHTVCFPSLAVLLSRRTRSNTKARQHLRGLDVGRLHIQYFHVRANF